MSTTDNFDALWAGLKEQVKAAREQGGDRDMIYTDNGSVYAGRISICKGDEDGASITTWVQSANVSINCQPDDLRAIAAQCLAAAEEVEEALEEAHAVRPNMKPLPNIPRVPMPASFPSIRTAE